MTIPKKYYYKIRDLPKNKIDEDFIKACYEGNLNTVKYLLTSPELKKHADIHANEEEGFHAACTKGHLEIIKYLLTSKELKEHANMSASNNLGFKYACQYEYSELIKFFIFDMNMEKNKNINEYLQSSANKEVENMFKIRDLNKQLEEELSFNKSEQQKFKL